jgi:phage protein D
MGEGSSLRPARPQITVDGRARTELAAGLLRMRIREDQHGMYSCEATFGNWGPAGGGVGFLYFGRDTLEFGKAFVVALDETTVFSGRIMAIEAIFQDGGAPELTVLAEDRFQDLRMTRRTRSFANVSDAGVMHQIASDHGLTPAVDVTGPTHKLLAQLNQSDLAFLRDRARAVDAELWLDGRTLHVAAHTRRNGGHLRIGYGHELIEFTVLADLAHQRSGVTVTGWDVAGKQRLSQRADARALGAELGVGDSGGSILGSALAERTEVVAHAALPLGAEEAQARAEALFLARARRFVRGHGIAQTDARLQAGAIVQLDALGPLFSGNYYVTEASIQFDGETGMRTHFTVERPGLGRAA